jgi:hypothetical protein
MRYFALASAEIDLNVRYPEKSAFDHLSGEAFFKRLFDEFWSVAGRELIDAHHSATDEAKISAFALVRSEQRWKAMRDKFSRYFKLTG